MFSAVLVEEDDVTFRGGAEVVVQRVVVNGVIVDRGAVEEGAGRRFADGLGEGIDRGVLSHLGDVEAGGGGARSWPGCWVAGWWCIEASEPSAEALAAAAREGCCGSLPTNNLTVDLLFTKALAGRFSFLA